MAKVITFIAIFMFVSIMMYLGGYSDTLGSTFSAFGFKDTSGNLNNTANNNCKVSNVVSVDEDGNPLSNDTSCKDYYWVLKYALVFIATIGILKFLVSGIQGIDLIAAAGIALVAMNFYADMLNILDYVSSDSWVYYPIFTIVSIITVLFVASLVEWVRGDH